MRSSRGSTISTPSDTRDASAQRSAGNALLVAAVVGVAIGAVVAGPVIGACAAAISTRRDRPPLVAVVIPGAMFVAEGVFLLYDRKVWRTNFGAEPYRLIDVGVAAALVVGGVVLASVFVERGRRVSALLGAAGVGLIGAFGFVLLERIIAAGV